MVGSPVAGEVSHYPDGRGGRGCVRAGLPQGCVRTLAASSALRRAARQLSPQDSPPLSAKVDLHTTRGHAVLTVTDDGPAIPPPERERIFEHFARLDSARSRDTRGIGLALTTARDIANAHHGNLTIDDTPTGTRFICRIPSGMVK